MTRIVFRRLGLGYDGTSEEYGEFHLDRHACVHYLQGQVAAYGIKADSLLLEWLQHDCPDHILPQRCEERARFMAAALWSDRTSCEIHCRACDEPIAAERVIKEEWEDLERGLIWVGVAGYRLLCPDNHSLIIIIERIY